MLTPESIEKLEKQNKIVQMYKQLNIDICADIIKRVSQTNNNNVEDNITYIKEQLKIMKSTGGDEIYKETLAKVSQMNTRIAHEMRTTYYNMTKQVQSGYAKLYEYRDLPMKLSSSQIKIINGAIKQSTQEFENLTNTVAFESKQKYVNAVDQAYFNVVTGGLDYKTAVENVVKEVANTGITLQDAAGRNVRIETAAKRNITTGIKRTADTINKELDEYLGCDGYETTAHAGARPTHAEWQGKQFAKTPEGAKKYGVPLWDKSQVSDEINDFNCRHTYFGIILGISEPVYSKSELKQMNEYSVVLNGKQVPYYEAKEKIQKIKNTADDYTNKKTIFEKALETNKNNNTMKKLYEKYEEKSNEWNNKFENVLKNNVSGAFNYQIKLKKTQESDIIKAVKESELKLKKEYDKAIKKGTLSKMVDYKTYEKIDNELTKLNGIKTYNDIEITGHAFHMIERVIGHVYETEYKTYNKETGKVEIKKDPPREGVSIDKIKRVLESNDFDRIKVNAKNQTITLTALNINVTINTDGNLVQTNKKGSGK